MNRANGFSWHERIRQKNDFKRVYEQGRKRVSLLFILYLYARGDGRQCRRVGITVSKKIGNAVTRNRCKRLVREIFRNNKHIFPAGNDIVVIVRREMVRRSVDEVQTEFYHILQGQSIPLNPQ